MVIRIDIDKKEARLSVGDLVSMIPRQGDYQANSALAGTTQGGIEAHQGIAHRRVAQLGSHYQAEVPIRERIVINNWQITIQGRIDGLIEAHGDTIVEEVKSSRRPLHMLTHLNPDDLPSATNQLKAYCAILGRRMAAVRGRLCLFSLPDQKEHFLEFDHDPDGDRDWLERHLEALAVSLETRAHRLASRRAWDRSFPFAQPRGAQLEMARYIEESIVEGKVALLEAPTGAGKTMAALWGAMRCADTLGKTVVWATARNPQQEAALDAARLLSNSVHELRASQIRGRDRLCFLEVPRCHPEDCHFAKGHYTRLDKARIDQPHLAIHDVAAFRSFAGQHEICPYDLALTQAEQDDLIICDVAHLFDPMSRLRRLWPDGDEAHLIIVIDEAHELPARARDWGSIDLELQPLSDQPWSPNIKELVSLLLGPAERLDPASPVWEERLSRAIAELGNALAFLQPGDDDAAISAIRQLSRMNTLLKIASTQPSAFIFERDASGIHLTCLDAAPILTPLLSKVTGGVMMSATLTPAAVFQRAFGQPDMDHQSFPDPFNPERRKVLLATQPSTRFRHRNQSAEAIATIIDCCLEKGTGHWLLYFPSFAYRDMIIPRLATPRRILSQVRDATDSARSEFLAELNSTHDEAKAFATILGGIFGSGIDPKPGQICGVAIVGPALPTIDPKNQAIRSYHDALGEPGFLHAYEIPGIQRVVQAAGRAMRSPTDAIAVVLIGQRFAQTHIQALLPRDWSPIRVTSNEGLDAQLTNFFDQTSDMESDPEPPF